MTAIQYEWIEEGRGLIRPEVEWVFHTRAPLVQICHTAETRETVALDIAGYLYRLNADGKVKRQGRGFKQASHLDWSADGELGVLCEGAFRIALLDRHFDVEWDAKFREDIRAVAISHNGDYLAAALNDSRTLIYDRFKKRVGSAGTKRSLDTLRFAWEDDAIIGTSDVGMLCSFSIEGKIDWSLATNARSGDLEVNLNASRLFLAAQSKGIQVYDGHGELEGAYQVKGSARRIALSPFGSRLAVVTAEDLLLWMNLEGKILWAGIAPEQIVSIECDGFGSRLFLGMESGEVCCLSWSQEN